MTWKSKKKKPTSKKPFVIMMDYTVSRSFPLLNFLLHQAISLTSLDQFLYFTDNFMVVSVEGIISRSTFDIMKLAYENLKIGNVLRVFFL